jgi:hypothetical protein
VLLKTSQRNWLVARLASYRITARILSRERYFLGWTSTLSPVDLALGWGKVADRAVDEYVSWSQAGRWYYFHWSDGCPLSTEELQQQSANVHIVPATSNLRRALLQVSRHDIVRLEGSLVSISAANGDVIEPWQSSLTRSDVGSGACEIMFVERLITHGLSYR